MKPSIATLVLATLALWATPGLAETITFETSGAVGAAPQDFTVAMTGRGQRAAWALQEVAGAPSGKYVVAQTSNEESANRFPLLVYDKITATDADISVKFKAVSGTDDQAAGLVWRYTDQNNYYVVRANALEDNVVLYIVRNGQRTDLPVKGKGNTYGAPVPNIGKSSWSTLAVSIKAASFTVSFNGWPLYVVEDRTFVQPGKVGLWTKSDSVMLFDDFTIENAK